MTATRHRAVWSFPTGIRFGEGNIAELAEACEAAGISRPMVVCDRMVHDSPAIQSALAKLRPAGGKERVFTDFASNPNGGHLREGVRMFLSLGFNGVVAIGGGSAIDIGKLVAFSAHQTLPVWDFEYVGGKWKRADVEAIRPVVAVPTTAGTGSEVGRAAMLTTDDGGRKMIIYHPGMMPAQVICDPVLTAGMPRNITAGTGMDAFAHCLEAFCSPGYHPMCDGIALEGMRLVAENLPVVMNEPGHLEARANMMSAASMGAVAFQKGLGAIHALSHPVGAMYGVHHGTTNALLMRAVLRFNASAVGKQLGRAAAYLGAGDSCEDFAGLVDRLLSGLDMPDGLAALGIERDRLDELAASALSDPSCAGNPVELTVESAKRLLEESL